MAPPAHASGTFSIGGELVVHRLGFGAMRLPGVRDNSIPPDGARALLREALRLGVDLIDTAWIYGRSEELIAAALHPYPAGLVIATKGGLRAGGHPDGRPERLRSDCEDSLRRLRVDTIDVWQLHRIDPAIPLEEQLGTVRELRDEGKIRFAGLSEVSLEELRQAQAIVEIATVQNRYNASQRQSDEVLAACEAEGIGFFPWSPIRVGEEVSDPRRALAWLLDRSPVMLPIPGTSSIEHLRENAGAALR
jgi:aryl-alcohol dehydrogenase-like predicted oxidoreductase